MTSRLQSFETELLTQEENLAGLAALNRELVARAEAIDSPRRVVLDMDSTEIPVYGQQEHSAYNGHFESTCYHPLLLFNREGDCLAARLRPGNVHSAEGWEELLLPEIERQQQVGKEVVFRADAAFAKPELYENSVGKTSFSGIWVPTRGRTGSLQRRGKRLGLNPGSTLRLQTGWCWWESGSGFKTKIPVRLGQPAKREGKRMSINNSCFFSKLVMGAGVIAVLMISSNPSAFAKTVTVNGSA